MIAQAAILALLAAAPVQIPQEARPEPEDFTRWIAEGRREEIPWTVKVSDPELHLDQRLRVNITVTLTRTSLNRHALQHDLLLLTRIGRPSGEWLPDTSRLGHRLEQPLARRTSLVFQVQALITPGEYRVGLVLLDRISGHRSVTIEPLRVEPIPDDPLQHSSGGAFRELPAVEFVRAEEGLDASYQPELNGRLWLPVQTRRPVQVELLVNFGHSEEFTVPRLSGRDNWWFGWLFRRSPQDRRSPEVERTFAMIIEALKPLADLSLRNGTLRVTGVDLARRSVIFDQDLAESLDWPRLRESLSGFSSAVVSAKTLAGQKESPQFFAEFLEERLCPSPPPSNGALSAPELQTLAGEPSQQEPFAPHGDAQDRPERVFVILSTAMLFARGAEVPRVTPPEECRCRVYHLRLYLLGHLWDQLAGMLEPLEPRRFDIRSPMDYRRALGAILEDLRQL